MDFPVATGARMNTAVQSSALSMSSLTLTAVLSSEMNTDFSGTAGATKGRLRRRVESSTESAASASVADMTAQTPDHKLRREIGELAVYDTSVRLRPR